MKFPSLVMVSEFCVWKVERLSHRDANVLFCSLSAEESQLTSGGGSPSAVHNKTYSIAVKRSIENYWSTTLEPVVRDRGYVSGFRCFTSN